jgi:hypothetical protein
VQYSFKRQSSFGTTTTTTLGSAVPPFQADEPQAQGTALTQILYTPNTFVNTGNVGNVSGGEESRPFPVVTIFTRGAEGDSVVELLQSLLTVDNPLMRHTLLLVDVSLDENKFWHGKYKYNLPVLHLGNYYWTLGRGLSKQQAALSLGCAVRGDMQPGRDQPNAAEMERQMAVPHVHVVTPRRASSGNFQKSTVQAIAEKGKGHSSCDLPPPPQVSIG